MPLLRDVFIQLSENKLLNDATKKMGLRFGAKKVVGGVSVDETIERIKDINRQGMSVTFDNLGEFITDKQDALEEKQNILDMIEAIDAHDVDAHASVKLSQIGLNIDYDFCLQNARDILSAAKDLGIFVNIDMEAFKVYDDTIHILDELLNEFDNVGTVIQSYLFASPDDVDKYKDQRLRIVKGAYKEAPEIAWQSKKDIDGAFLQLLKQHLTNGNGYTSIATHDHNIIEEIIDFIDENNIDSNQFEFQMLYGFRKDYQGALVDRGFKTVVYVPFGNDWYAYFMRRLAERPQNINLLVKSATKDPRFQAATISLAVAATALITARLLKR